MGCERVRELLPGYVGGELDEAGDVEIHLASCAACGDVLASYRSMRDRLEALPASDPPVPAAFIERVLAQIPDPTIADRIRGSVRDHRVAYAAGIGGAAVAALAVAFAIRRARAGGRVGAELAPAG